MLNQALHIECFCFLYNNRRYSRLLYTFTTQCAKLDHDSAAKVSTAIEYPSPSTAIVTDDSCSLCRNHNTDVGSVS